MREQRIVLCGASAYEKKFYLNPEFDGLPGQVKDELKIACVLYTEDVGGIITMEFDEDGQLEFVVDAKEDDFLYDEIGSRLKVKQLQREKRELWEALELYYRIFFPEVEDEQGRKA